MKNVKKSKSSPFVPSILPPTSDFVFKLIFGDPKNTDILIAFLKAVLDLPPEEYERIDIINPYLKKELKTGKEGILDVKLHTKSKNVIDIEIQVDSDTPMRERITFYVSKMLTEQIGSGSDYDVMKRVISIVITDYKLFDDVPYQHRFRLYDKEHNIEFTDIVEVNTLELPKLPAVKDSEIWNWLTFLNVKQEKELDMIAQVSTELGKAAIILKELSADEEARLLYDSQEMARMDRAAAERRREQRVRAEGVAKGRAEGVIEIARSMKAMNYPVADITKLTGLTSEEIETLG
ncbi:transposase [Planctomycetales bacterium]|nr:transposase [Planctomycetales bacterium]